MLTSHEAKTQSPLFQFLLTAKKFITECEPLVVDTTAEALLEAFTGDDPIEASVKELKHHLSVFEPKVLSYEQAREETPYRIQEGKLDRLQSAEEEQRKAQDRSLKLPQTYHEKKTALEDQIKRLEEEGKQALLRLTTELQSEIKAKGEEERKITAERDELERQYNRLNESICCRCFSFFHESKFAQLAEIDRKITEKNKQLTATRLPVDEKEHLEKARQKTAETIQKTTEELRQLAETFSKESEEAKETLIEAKAHYEKVKLQIDNEKKYYHATVSNELMLHCLQFYKKILQLQNAASEKLLKDTSLTHVSALFDKCIEYRNDWNGFMNLLWCPESEDRRGKEISEAFDRLPKEVQANLLSKTPSPDSIKQLLPLRPGIRLAQMQKGELTLDMITFKPTHLSPPTSPSSSLPRAELTTHAP